MNAHVVIPITDTSSIGEARRAAQTLAQSVGLSENDRGRAMLVISELATNLVRHAPATSTMLLGARPSLSSDVPAVAPHLEILAIDSGPGMDIARSFQDGYSTAGTPGNGLGAVQRLSDRLDVFSSPQGTILFSCVGPPAGALPPTGLQCAGLSVPAPGEVVCGDAWRMAQRDGRLTVIVADGLGHGPLAADAARVVCGVFDKDPFADPRAIIDAAHTAATASRGAAVAIARIDEGAGVLTFAGVGNIAGMILTREGKARGLVSHNGIVGHQMRKVQALEYPWTPTSILVMHSDGLQTRWSLEKYPGILQRHPAVIAAALLRDFRRERDDVTVVVAGAVQSSP